MEDEEEEKLKSLLKYGKSIKKEDDSILDFYLQAMALVSCPDAGHIQHINSGRTPNIQHIIYQLISYQYIIP